MVLLTPSINVQGTPPRTSRHLRMNVLTAEAAKSPELKIELVAAIAASSAVIPSGTQKLLPMAAIRQEAPRKLL
jgi:hypothetical protein